MPSLKYHFSLYLYMSSLLPGYEYDIFISYRQKDNRSDQWVTHFVQALREELDATFKESISIYFDSNPHDGLLETHDVDGSLKEKIKCLVFIPIVSQTYCDPKSFAWQKEFRSFVEFAKGDQFGLDIKLGNGNVAKRVLPVRIHEIDEADKKLFEDVIGGVLRPVDFIYKSPGVNRPLKASDIPERNLNRTIYGDQINKIANSLKDIVNAVMDSDNPLPRPIKKNTRNSPINIKRLVALAIVAILFTSVSIYVILGWVGIIDLSNQEQSPIHKIILPIFIVSVFIIIARLPVRRMGHVILQVIAVVVIGGGIINIVYTFTSPTLPDPMTNFLSPVTTTPDKVVALERVLLRQLGAALIAVGVGAWFLLHGKSGSLQALSLWAVVLMFTITEGMNTWALYYVRSPFYIYSGTYLILTWIGAILWWFGGATESIAKDS